MKKSVLCFSLSLCFLGTSVFANDCLDKVEDHIFNDGTMLELARCKINDNDMQTVAAVLKKNPNITEVYLNHNDISSDGIRYLTDSNFFIKRLSVADNKLGSYGAQLIAKMFFLELLDIDDNNIGDEGARELAKNDNIEQLFVADNNLSGAGISAIASHPAVWNLGIGHNRFNKDGLAALSRNKKLRWLSVRDSNLSAEDIEVLVEHLKSIEELDVSANPIGNNGIKAIAQKIKLRALAANGCAIGNEGAIAAASMPNLDELELVKNHIGNTGAAALAQSKISDISLGDNDIDDEGASAFAQSKINELCLHHNEIENAGAIALAKNNSLKLLDISHNMIGDAGIDALKKSTIEMVNFDGNTPYPVLKKAQMTHFPKTSNHVFYKNGKQKDSGHI